MDVLSDRPLGLGPKGRRTGQLHMTKLSTHAQPQSSQASFLLRNRLRPIFNHRTLRTQLSGMLRIEVRCRVTHRLWARARDHLQAPPRTHPTTSVPFLATLGNSTMPSNSHTMDLIKGQLIIEVDLMPGSWNGHARAIGNYRRTVICVIWHKATEPADHNMKPVHQPYNATSISIMDPKSISGTKKKSWKTHKEPTPSSRNEHSSNRSPTLLMYHHLRAIGLRLNPARDNNNSM